MSTVSSKVLSKSLSKEHSKVPLKSFARLSLSVFAFCFTVLLTVSAAPPAQAQPGLCVPPMVDDGMGGCMPTGGGAPAAVMCIAPMVSNGAGGCMTPIVTCVAPMVSNGVGGCMTPAPMCVAPMVSNGAGGCITPNTAPTVSTFTKGSLSGTEDAASTITFAQILSNSNATDTDGTVTGFKVSNVGGGTLLIGGSQFIANMNDTVTAAKPLTWTPPADRNGVLDIAAVKAVDNDGAISSQLIFISATVAPTNDAPKLQHSLPAAVTFSEDAWVAGAPLLTSVSISDIDDDQLTLTAKFLQTTSTPPAPLGTLTLAASSDVTLDGSTPGIITVKGTAAKILTYIKTANNIKFQLAKDVANTATSGPIGSVTLSVTDGVETATSPAISVNVTPVNDLPVVTLPSVIARTEDLAEAVSITGITVTDVDNDSITITVTAPGKLIATPAAGITIATAKNENGSGFKLTGSPAAIQSYLRDGKLVYTPRLNIFGPPSSVTNPKGHDETFFFEVTDQSDGSMLRSAGSVAMNITAVNDAPSIAQASPITVSEGASRTLRNLNISDVDDELSSLTVTITTPPAHGSFSIISGIQAAQFSIASGPNGVSRASLAQAATAPVAMASQRFAADTFLRDIGYFHDGSETLSDSFAFTVTDGKGGSTNGTANITITPVNDAPELININGDSVDYELQSAAKPIDTNSDGMLKDIDGVLGKAMSTFSITIYSSNRINTSHADDKFKLVGNGIIGGLRPGSTALHVTIDNRQVGTITSSRKSLFRFDSSAPLNTKEFERLLHSISFENQSSQVAAEGQRTFILDLNFGLANGSRSYSFGIKVLPAATVDDNTLSEVVGDLMNEGTLAYIEVTENSTLSGGELAGDIENRGEIKDVDLFPFTRINGGTVKGDLRGTAGSPALINALIGEGAKLQDVIVGMGSSIEGDVSIGKNVRFESLDNIPPNTDLTNAVDSIPWEKRPAVSSVNLDNSLRTDESGGLTLLQSIRQLDEYEPAGFSVNQDDKNGELILNGDDFDARLLPVQIRRADPGAKQTTTFTEDGDISIVTVTQQEVISFPLVNDEQQLRDGLGDDLQLNFDDRANLVISGPGLGSDGDKKIEATARPALQSVPARPGASKGLQTFPNKNLPGVNSVSIVFEDENGELQEQDLVPVPADWLSLKTALREIAGAEGVRISTDGVISLTINGIEFKGLTEYTISRGGEGAGSGTLSFEPVRDLNGDGIDDIRIIYANGDSQNMFLF